MVFFNSPLLKVKVIFLNGTPPTMLGVESDQTQLMVEVPAISYFAIPTGKGVLVWFHFLLSAGLLLTGYC